MQQITHRLIVYVITDKRRLQRVHRCCGQYALSMQNSVFLFQGRPEQWQQFYQALHQLLDTHSDALWVFELDHSQTCQQLGHPALPAGIILQGQTCLNALIT